MRVFNDRVRNYTQCDRLQSRSLEDSYENSCPTNSQWRNHSDHPELCEERETWLRSHLPMNDLPLLGGYRGRNVIVLYFEPGLAVGVLLTVTTAVTICFSVGWAVKRDDI